MKIEITEQERRALFQAIAESTPEKLGISEKNRVTLGKKLSWKPKKVKKVGSGLSE